MSVKSLDESNFSYDQIKSKTFLGQEFLTWLWYYIEETGGFFTLQASNGSSDDIEIWVDNKIAMESSSRTTSKQQLIGGQPSESIEATAALLDGKFVTEMALGLTCKDRKYGFALSSKDLTPKGIHFSKPKETQSTTDQEMIGEKIQQIKKLINIVDQIFIRYLDTRSNKNWETQELDDLKEWIQNRGKSDFTRH